MKTTLILIFTLTVQFLPEGILMANDKPTNALIHEKSPYLLQHAHNPVDWYPWGEEAFNKAKKEDKPIFLSIGYSTCHWCHVMEHESFSNIETAKIMNEHFVNIKVDREERPDIDQIYMNAVMAMTGQGGWPLSVFLTPEGKPFFGGTYYPPQQAWGRPSFTQILQHIIKLWKEKREDVNQAAQSLTQAVNQSLVHAAPGKLKPEILDQTYTNFENSFDSNQGGFETAPKFPRAHSLSFLLRYSQRAGEREALNMVLKTLDEMAKGGIYDQLGGGFHRYSTDQYWHVPHFEKMLYDQAINAKAYLEAYQVTKNKAYVRIIRETLNYVLRDMTSPEGGFYSAEDADSAVSHERPNEKVEGTFFVFEKQEIESVLNQKEAEMALFAFGVQEEGNAGTGAHGELKKKNVLFQTHSVEEIARKFNFSPEQAEDRLKLIKQQLFDYREKRPRPHLDDKILTDWNGLMISTLAFAGRVLEEPTYIEAAQNAANFILDKLRRKDGRLLHRFRDGEAAIPGFLDDYAFFIHGLIDLYQADFNLVYLDTANQLTQQMIALFWDKENSGFYLTANDSETLIARTKDIYDGAIPSGNSLALLDLVRLGRLTMNKEYEQKAEQALNLYSEKIEAFPNGYPQMLISFLFALGPSQEILLTQTGDAETLQQMVQTVYRFFLPNKVLALRPAEATAEKVFLELVPFAKEQVPIEKQVTAYVCQNYVCNRPVTNPQALKELIEK